jgi:hypothetical protein
MAFENGAGVVPVMDINRGGYGYGDGFGYGGGCMWFMWIFVIFALMGGGGFGGWGGGNAALNGALTRNDLFDGFNSQDIKDGIRGIQNGLCDGFYAQNTNTLQGFNNVGRDILESRYQLGAAIAENRFAQQSCCCETNRSIDAVRAENYKNTCEITNAIHAEGEATRALINANVMQELRDKLADRDRDLMTANFQLSQQAQNARLIEEIRPFPKPSYQTCSPYESARGHYGYGYGGCGCGVAA